MGFMFEVNLEGLDTLAENLKGLDDILEEGMREGVGRTVLSMEDTAKDLCPVDTGALRESIHSGVNVDDGQVQGFVGTNYETAPYVEFGTGPEGRDTPVEGKYPGPLNYREDGWWIHESQISAETAEKYHFFKLETPDGVFYFTNGQPAQPFLYPALMAHKDDAPAITAEAIKRLLEERMKP